MENVTDLNETKTFLAHQIAQLSWTDILTGIILYSIVVVTILGNILVLIAVAVNKNLQTTFNYYVVNLAITDLAVAVTAMSFHTTNNVLRYWPFGSFLCGVWIFFDYGMTFVSVFTLILISVDRFWSVTWSVHYHQHHSKRNTIIAIIIIWYVIRSMSSNLSVIFRFILFLWIRVCLYFSYLFILSFIFAVPLRKFLSVNFYMYVNMHVHHVQALNYSQCLSWCQGYQGKTVILACNITNLNYTTITPSH